MPNNKKQLFKNKLTEVIQDLESRVKPSEQEHHCDAVHELYMRLSFQNPDILPIRKESR